jgi:hypothetical protein
LRYFAIDQISSVPKIARKTAITATKKQKHTKDIVSIAWASLSPHTLTHE